MLKSALIVGAITFFLTIGAALLSPFCTICLPLFTGLTAGYLTGVFDKPTVVNTALTRGAIAGAIVGAVAWIAQMIASVINILVLQNPQFNPGRLFGTQVDPTTIWAGQLGGGFCIGLLNVALMAAFAAAGAAIWANTAGKSSAPAPAPEQY